MANKKLQNFVELKPKHGMPSKNKKSIENVADKYVIEKLKILTFRVCIIILLQNTQTNLQ